MLFTIPKEKYMTLEQLRQQTLVNAYYIISEYPMHASEVLLDKYIQQQYKSTLKELCIELLLSLTFYADDNGDLVLLFKDPKDDALARLVTFGIGAIPGSQILQIALTK